MLPCISHKTICKPGYGTLARGQAPARVKAAQDRRELLALGQGKVEFGRREHRVRCQGKVAPARRERPALDPGKVAPV